MEVVGEAVVGTLVVNLISLVQGEVDLLRSVEGNIGHLSSKLATIQDVLEDAENAQFKNKSITVWLRKLKNAVYDAEDVLDEWMIGTLQVSNTRWMDQVSNSFSTFFSFNRIGFRQKLENKLTEIISQFDEIAAVKSQFDLKVNDRQRSEPKSDENREKTFRITEPLIYGRGVDKEIVTLTLLNHVGTQEDVFVYPIVGMGGIGKTTLAQMVFNDKRVEDRFEVRIWVCVSETFNIKTILKAIVEGLYKEPCVLDALIENEVRDILKDRRYLLVLDDVWNKSQNEWSKLKSFLVGGAQGSSVILTTRLKEVASVTSVVEPYAVGALSDDDSWALSRHYAFGGSCEEEYPDMVEIGMEITKKCRGVPLALKSVGSLLEKEKQWECIRDSEIWKLKQDEDNSILPALKLSYNHLPSCLKQCFAYCSIFPKDYKLEMEKLIGLWIANGFVQSQESREPEEVGEDIFNELLQRSFFQEVKEDEYRNIKTCKMHDLMHDLAVSVSLDECLVEKMGESGKHVPKTIRHLSVITDSPQLSSRASPFLEPQLSLRTLLFYNSIKFDSFKLSCTLRALDLSDMELEKLPPSICHLKLLKYLDLSSNDIISLPESICQLRNLQMLDLSNNKRLYTLPISLVKLERLRHLNLSSCSIFSLPGTLCDKTSLQSLLLQSCIHLKKLPETMRNLTSLKHLNILGCDRLINLPVGIGQLTCLQTLRGNFTVDGGCGVAGISDLQRLNQLRGRLDIRGLEKVRNIKDATTANLRSKQYLTELSLWWQHYSGDESNDKEVLEGLLLRPPPNLQVLNISGYGTEKFPPQIFQGVGVLNALQALTLTGCQRLKSLPVEIGNLTALTYLQIGSCMKLVSFPQELQKLTALTTLRIMFCPSMICLPMIGGKEKSSNSLTDLEISHCENLTSVSEGLRYLTSLQRLHIGNCKKLEFVSEKDEDDFQHLASLVCLELKYLPLAALPDGIQHLTTLERLRIWDWKNLRTLPEWLKRLTTLRTLNIYNSHSVLKARCEKDKGEDWHNISHIPNFHI